MGNPALYRRTRIAEDARTPDAHASTHAAGGTDPIPAPARQGCDAYQTVDITLTNVTYVLLSFGAENWDTGAFHSTTVNPSRFTVPAGGDGLYQPYCHLAPNFTEGRAIYRLYKNGVVQAPHQSGGYTSGGGNVFASVFPPISLVAGDYIEYYFYQGSGADSVLPANTWNHAGLFWISL